MGGCGHGAVPLGPQREPLSLYETAKHVEARFSGLWSFDNPQRQKIRTQNHYPFGFARYVAGKSLPLRPSSNFSEEDVAFETSRVSNVVFNFFSGTCAGVTPSGFRFPPRALSNPNPTKAFLSRSNEPTKSTLLPFVEASRWQSLSTHSSPSICFAPSSKASERPISR